MTQLLIVYHDSFTFGLLFSDQMTCTRLKSYGKSIISKAYEKVNTIIAWTAKVWTSNSPKHKIYQTRLHWHTKKTIRH